MSNLKLEQLYVKFKVRFPQLELGVFYNPNKYRHYIQSFWGDKCSESLLRILAFPSSWFLNHAEAKSNVVQVGEACHTRENSCMSFFFFFETENSFNELNDILVVTFKLSHSNFRPNFLSFFVLFCFFFFRNSFFCFLQNTLNKFYWPFHLQQTIIVVRMH